MPFFLGYYAHLIIDAAFTSYILDDNRFKAVWRRINADDNLRVRAKGYPEDWESVKKVISKKERKH